MDPPSTKPRREVSPRRRRHLRGLRSARPAYTCFRRVNFLGRRPGEFTLSEKASPERCIPAEPVASFAAPPASSGPGEPAEPKGERETREVERARGALRPLWHHTTAQTSRSRYSRGNVRSYDGMWFADLSEMLPTSARARAIQDGGTLPAIRYFRSIS